MVGADRPRVHAAPAHFELPPQWSAMRKDPPGAEPGPDRGLGIASTFLLFLDDGDEVILSDTGYPPDEFWARHLRASIRDVRFRDPRQPSSTIAALLYIPFLILVRRLPQKWDQAMLNASVRVSITPYGAKSSWLLPNWGLWPGKPR